nr:chaperonin-like protein [Tanacetum cinerariifolium]
MSQADEPIRVSNGFQVVVKSEQGVVTLYQRCVHIHFRKWFVSISSSSSMIWNWRSQLYWIVALYAWFPSRRQKTKGAAARVLENLGADPNNIRTHVTEGGSTEAKTTAYWPTLAPNVEDYSQLIKVLICSLDHGKKYLGIVNKLRGALKIAALKAPGFGKRKIKCLDDIVVLTRAGVFTLQAPVSANAMCLSILIPNAVKALPSKAEQRYNGCD